MANLKQDLDEYLLLQSDQKKSFKMKLPELKVPDLSNLLPRSRETQEANGWLKDTQESCCPKLSRIQRIIGFIICLCLGVLCFTISTFYIPLLLLKARKFAILYTMGSVFFILSFCFLSGFGPFFKQMFSRQRLIISGTYTSSLMATLYCALIIQSTAFTVLFAVIQIIALLFMILSSIPGGTAGIKFFGQMFRSSVSSSTLPV